MIMRLSTFDNFHIVISPFLTNGIGQLVGLIDCESFAVIQSDKLGSLFDRQVKRVD